MAERTAPDLGPKARSLRLLAEADLPVPPARFLDTDAYREHARRAGVETLLAEAASSPEGEGLDPAPVRDAIRRTAISEEVADTVRAWRRELGGGGVVVRSSANAEDLGDASFAGQHGTYFVRDGDDPIRRVKDCWASLFSDRATRYRERSGVAHDDVAMAVIVQKLVPARAAGVAFTADPVDGSPVVLVEACAGIGEALVSGKVTPDRFLIDRDRLEVRDLAVGGKRVRVVADSEGAVAEQPVPESEAFLPSIDEATAQEVARLALRAEGLLGVPVDVEWAFDGETIWLLQARPITTLARAAAASASAGASHPTLASETPVIWSNVNTGEILPDVVSPMTWTIIHGHADDIFSGMFGAFGLRIDAQELIGLVGGRIYFNVSLLRDAFTRLPGVDLDRLFGGMQEFIELPPLPPTPKRRGGARIVLRILVAMPSYVWRHTPRKAALFARWLRGETDTARERLAAGPPADDAYRILEAQIRKFSEFNDSLAFMAVAMFGFGLLTAVCRRWLGDESGALANRLVAGRGDVASAQAGHALWRLAALARGSAELREAVAGEAPWERVRAALERLESSGAPTGGDAARFLEAWGAFMAEHGHHRRGELEFVNATWAERPDYVLGVLRGYIGRDEEDDPLTAYAKRSAEADLAADECRRRLGDPFRRYVFGRALAWGRSSAFSRENVKSEAVRWLVSIREALLVLGRHMVERGVLERAEDVFFLGYDEIAPALSVPATARGAGWRSTVASRRAERDRLSRLSPPPVVVGDWDEAEGSWAVSADVRILRGISVSAGVARGPARVFVSTETDAQVLAGEILVAPFTDPGWTPYFVPAAGIVMDMGGMLSHGSIIAREYGIPAVVNVGPASRLIVTGQMIEVDGDKGEVRILDSVRESEAPFAKPGDRRTASTASA